MRGKIVLAGLILGLSGMVAAAQDQPNIPRSGDVYCSGMVTSESIPQDTYVITGEQSSTKITFDEGDYVYVNKGSDQGVKVGDEFSAIRSLKDPYGIEWTKWEFAILHKMGTVWEDEGRVKVIVVRQNTFDRASGALLRLPPARRYLAALRRAPSSSAEVRGQL